jgi:hypothetical protein
MKRDPYHVFKKSASATLKLLLLSESWQSSGGNITSATDLSGNGNNVSVTGTSALVTSAGISGGTMASGIRFDAAISLNDLSNGCVIWLLMKPGTTNNGTHGYFVDTTDSYNSGTAVGTVDRGPQVKQIVTNLVARRAQSGDTGQVGYVFNSTDLALYRFEFSSIACVISRNGVWQASVAIPASGNRTMSRIRFGQRMDKSLPAVGELYEVAVYEGTPSELEIDNIEATFMAHAGITGPFRWPIDPVSTPNPLRWLTSIPCDVIAGVEYSIFKDAVAYADGAISITADIPNVRFANSPTDRWTFTLPDAGTYYITFTAGSQTSTLTLNCVDPVSNDATPIVAHLWGDSRADRANAGAQQIVGDALGSLIQWVGSRSPNTGYSYNHDGVDSSTTVDWNSATREFFNAGVLDIAHFYGTLAASPTVSVAWISLNDVYNALQANVNAAITTALSNLDAIFAAMVANGTTVILLAMGEPLATDPTHGWLTTSNRNQYHERVVRLFEALATHYANHANVKLMPMTFLGCDGVRDYAPTEVLHENNAPGHARRVSKYLEAALAAHCY